eukprot:scaffold293596_cov28-Tisochrysis_lutea.AAC.2
MKRDTVSGGARLSRRRFNHVTDSSTLSISSRAEPPPARLALLAAGVTASSETDALSSKRPPPAVVEKPPVRIAPLAEAPTASTALSDEGYATAGSTEAAR